MRQISAMIRVTVKELLRKKDFYVILFLMPVFLGFMASQSFFGVKDSYRYVIDMGYSLAIFFSVVLAVIISARQMPSELESKTIYPLLAKPISRRMVIVSKFFGGLFASIVSFSAFYAVFIFFYVVSGPAGNYLPLVQSYILGVLLMALVCSLSVFLTTFLTLSAGITLAFIFYATSVNLSSQFRDLYVFSKGAWAVVYGVLYYIFPHFEFYDVRSRIVHAWEPLTLALMCSITLYTFLFSAFLVTLSGEIFRRRGL